MKKLSILLVLFFWCATAFASSVTKVIVGSGNWTEPLSSEKGARISVSIGDYNATTDMTITLQRLLPGETSWGHDVDTWDVTGSSPDYEYITKPEAENGVFYRIGCDTGDYTSGNCTVRLGGGRK